MGERHTGGWLGADPALLQSTLGMPSGGGLRGALVICQFAIVLVTENPSRGG